MTCHAHHTLTEPDDEETLRTPVDGLLADEMQSIGIMLYALPDSPRRRELCGRFGTYERALGDAKRSASGQAQRWALLELVSLLRRQTLDYAGRFSGTTVAR